MSIKIFKNKFFVMLLILVFSFSFASCNVKTSNSNSNWAQGVTKDKIVIGTHLPLSGPVAVVGTPVLRGLQAYINYVNDNGGVNGRKIEIIAEDDQFNPAIAIQKVQKLVEQDKVFAIVGATGTPSLLAVMDYMVEKGIPAVYQGSGSSKFATPFKKNYFPVQPNYTMEGKLFAQYVVENLNAKKIVFMYQNDDIGKEGLEGFKTKLREMGKESLLVAEIAFNSTDVDFSVPVLKAKEQNPDVVILYGVSKPAAAIVKEAKKISFKPQFVATYILSDLTMFALAGDAWNDALVAGWAVPITDQNDPKVKLFFETVKKYNPNDVPSGYHLAGWIAGQVFVEGLKRAGDNLSWDGFIKAMETFKDWNEGLAYKLTYTENDHSGQKAMYFMKAVYKGDKDYKYEIVTPFIELK